MDWPARFVYVCNATQASIVNILPIVHAGIDRIAEVIIFCGAPTPGTHDPTLRREAINPARRLREFVAEFTKGARSSPNVRFCYGDPENYSQWRQTMAATCDSARRDNLQVLYNLTGGRKLMSVGAVSGGQDWSVIVHVGGAPLRTEFLADGRQIEAPRYGELSLEQYLSIYGMTEIEADKRHETEDFCRIHSDVITAFGDALLPGGLTLIPQLNRLAYKLFTPEGDFAAGIIDANKAKPEARVGLAKALAKLDGIPGIDLRSADEGTDVSIRVTTRRAAEFLNGRWFESYLFAKLSEAFHGRNDLRLNANIRLRYANSKEDTARKERGEIDVAVMIRSQLHIVEAKVANFSFGKGAAQTERSLSQIESLKRHLLGQFGRTFVVNPRESEKWIERAAGDFGARAENAGIDLLLGRNCVRRLIERLGRL